MLSGCYFKMPVLSSIVSQTVLVSIIITFKGAFDLSKTILSCQKYLIIIYEFMDSIHISSLKVSIQ